MISEFYISSSLELLDVNEYDRPIALTDRNHTCVLAPFELKDACFAGTMTDWLAGLNGVGGETRRVSEGKKSKERQMERDRPLSPR